MKQVVEFLTLLHENNDKAWFDSHKEMYKRALSCFEEFTAKPGSTASPLSIRPCADSRSRTVRGASSGTPASAPTRRRIRPTWVPSSLHAVRKAAIRATISTSNRCGTNAPGRTGITTTGLYCPLPEVLRSVRDEILDNGAEIEAAIREAKGSVLDESNKLKRLPKGYAPGSPYDEWLKLKDVYITERLAPEFMLDKELLKNTLHEFRKTKHFSDILNRAVQFAYDEMI